MKTLSSIERSQSLKKLLGDNEDVIIKQINLGDKKACLVFVDELVDLKQINLNIIKPLNLDDSASQVDCKKIIDDVVSFNPDAHQHGQSVYRRNAFV